jgi:hypothetical protein
MLRRRLLGLVAVVSTVLALSPGAKAQVYVAYYDAGIINKYDADTGALIRERFIDGLNKPRGLCLANGILYVVQTGAGFVSAYHADTGAVINAQFIPSLNMPQAMTVSGDSLYVASFTWQWQQGMGPSTNIIGKYNAITGAGVNPMLVKTDSVPLALAASDRKLYISGGSPMGRQIIYDANTGSPLKEVRALEMLVNDASSFALRDHTLWLTVGSTSTMGMVFKFDLDAGPQPISLGPFPPPLIRKLDHPLAIAVSGDQLFVSGPGSSVSTYDANTGDLIRAGFIPDRSDHISGIAVVPKAPSNQVSWAEMAFSAKNDFRNAALWSSVNGNYLYLASGGLVGAVVLGFLAVIFFRSVPKWLGPNPAAPTPAPTESQPAPIEPAHAEHEDFSTPVPAAEAAPAPEEQLSADGPPVESHSRSPWTAVVVVLITITLGLAAFLAWVGSQALPSPDVLMRGPDTHDLIGIWSYENVDRQPSEMPVLLSLEIYSTRLNFSTGNGPHFKDGRWHDDGFWCQAPDGSGEVEVAKVTSPEEIEFHRSAIDPADRTVDHLYKDRGSDAELAAVAAKYPSPVTYPPPTDVFKYWMSEYDLKCLPWRPDHIEVTGESYARGIVYVYKSDDPKLPQVDVMVKNRRVVKVSTGPVEPYIPNNP